MLNVVASSVERLTLEPRGGQAIAVGRTSRDQWQIQSVGPYLASSATVNEMLSTLRDLQAQRVIEGKPENLSLYGLNEPEFQLQIQEQASQTTLSFGDRAPGGGVYATVSGDPRVFLAPTFAEVNVDKTLDDLRDKRLLPVDVDTVANFSLMQPEQTIQFVRVHGGWQVQKPQIYRGDTFQVESLLNQVVGANWLPSTDPAKAAAAFAQGKPVATVTLDGSSGRQSMDVREDHGAYFARSSVAPGIWQVDAAVGEAVSRKLDSFRNKQLFDLSYGDPDKVEAHVGAKALLLTRSGKTWWSAGTKMDAGSVEDLLSALRSLAATGFVDSGLTSPTIRLTVTSNGGKQVETVEMQPTKNGAIAKRTDGDSLYAINSDMLQMLTNAISGVKPAARK